MTYDHLFRLILLVAVMIFVPVGIYHRVKATTGERLDRRQEGLFMFITLRVSGFVGWLGLAAYLINPDWMRWASAPLPIALRWAGVGLLIISGTLFVWTFRNLGNNLTDTVVTRANHTLVTTGPYRWVRHPFYTAAALAIPANSLTAANWFLFVIGSIIFLLLVMRTRTEEKHLVARFGDDYRHYMKRTGRFVPRPLHKAVLVFSLLFAFTAAEYVLNRLFAERNAISVRKVLTLASGPSGRFDGRLKLASFNIAHGRGTNGSNFSNKAEREARLNDIAGLLKREDVDIAVLNEVDFGALWTGHKDQGEIIARKAGFAYYLGQRNFDVAIPFLRLRSGNVILSRFPIESARLVKLPMRSNFEWWVAGGKQGVLADIRVDDHQLIRIFAVHLEWRDKMTRIRSAAAIVSCATNSPVPFFCLGDFNSTLTTIPSGSNSVSAVDFLLSEGKLKTLPSNRAVAEQFTFASYAPTRTIDWIMIPSDWEFIEYEALDLQLSDHRPVLAEVEKQR